ncbi:MAG: trehalose-6-phosphate synthase [Gemmatimonadota bacterium]
MLSLLRNARRSEPPPDVPRDPAIFRAHPARHFRSSCLMGLIPFFGRSAPPRLVLLSNREPIEHRCGPDGDHVVTEPAGGMTAALQPAMAATGGTWIAWGSGPADFEVTDPAGRLLVPPDRPTYLLRRIALTEKEIEEYYLDIANRALWPLCHLQLNHFTFNPDSWKTYVAVNRRFAEAADEEIDGRRATVWIQDYHLALVAGLLPKARNVFVHQFWHIPWPPPDVLRALPSARALLRGILANDLLGFHTRRYVVNFFACVADLLPTAKTDEKRGIVRYRNHKTTVRHYPISIDVRAIQRLSARPDLVERSRELREQSAPPGGQLILGVDRADYTKGIPHRLAAFGRLLDQHPELQGRVSLVQIAVPSRSDIAEYKDLEREMEHRTTVINQRHGTPEWCPIVLIKENLDMPTLVAWYRAADICIVSPVQDGMNLVAKEYIAAQDGRNGVLLLSQFAGAAEEMEGALLINPYDEVSLARILHVALTMGRRERELRLKVMQRRLSTHTVQRWIHDIFSDVKKLRGRR